MIEIAEAHGVEPTNTVPAPAKLLRKVLQKVGLELLGEDDAS